MNSTPDGPNGLGSRGTPGAASAPRVLVVVAHPDDESFGCGSLLLHAAGAGAVTSVLCATRGEAGQITGGSGATEVTLASVREQELRTAADLLGVRQVELLDYRDSGMAGEAHPATLVGAPFEQVRDEIQAALVRFAPDIVITLDASDGHRDHARIRDVTLAAVAQLTSQPDDSKTAPWTARVYLHCLPQSLMKRWFAHMAQQHPDSPYLGTAPGTPEELITTVIDTSAHLTQREKAIKAHASQTSPYEGLPADLRRAFLTTDQLQRVIPPWTGGERESDIFG